MKRPQKASPRAATQTLSTLLTQTATTAAERRRLLRNALGAAEARSDYELLGAVLKRSEEAGLRADALAVVLNLADESHPHFCELLDALRDGERTLVLGALLEATRLEPDSERRLLRLNRLVKVIPQASRSFYWPEAEALAEQGGDDAQLALLGFVRELSPLARPLTAGTLRRAAGKVQNAFKRAMAFVSLADLTGLSRDDLTEAEASAARIPDETLRIMTFTRLAQLEGRKSN